MRCLRFGARGCVIACGGKGGGVRRKGGERGPSSTRTLAWPCRAFVCAFVCVCWLDGPDRALVARALLATQGLDPTAFWTANACWRT